MSGVLHPVGPEQPRTYWQRRGIVIIGALAVIVALIVVIANLAGGSDQQQAVPAGATTQAASTPAATPGTAARTPAAASTPKSSEKATAAPPKASASAKASTAAPPPSKAPTPACTPSQLRATLRGDQSLKVEQKNTFTISVINGGPTTCIVSVTPSTFELKIYSGTDRIWSTDDCSTSVKPIEKAVGSEAEIEWTLTWNGRRSAEDCKNRSEIPQAGTYFATAQLKGADPVQLRMTLRG